MGAEPKRKISKARKGRRRAHNALKTTSTSKCPKYGAVKRNHFECSNCSIYK